MTKLLLIFLAGFVIDVLIVGNIKAVSRKQVTLAVLTSGAISLIYYGFVVLIISDIENAWQGIASFVSGNMAGTYAVMKMG